MLQPNDPSIYDTLERMEAHGGGFVSRLVSLFRHADLDNKKRILETWPELFEEFGPKGMFASPQQRAHSYAYEWTQLITIRPSK